MNKFFISFVVVFLSIDFALAKVNQEGEGLSVLKTKDGFLFVFNQRDESFLIELKGKKFLDVESEELIFSIDGQVIQFTIVPFSVFLKEGNSEDTLIQHFEFEMGYIKSQLGKSVGKIKPQRITLKQGGDCLVWNFDVPGDPKDTSSEKVVKQLLATTKSFSNIVMLSSPLTRADDVTQCKNRFIQSFETFCYKQGLFDIQSIRDSLTAETEPRD
jgi:hypothetical protein